MIKTFDIIVAMDAKSGIGKNNQLAWSLPPDMAHFKDITTQTLDSNKRNAVLMGRKTWESIPERFRPLSGRLNIVLTASKDRVFPRDVFSCDGLKEAFDLLGGRQDIESIFVIGGASVYEQALKTGICRNIYATQLFEDFSCDVFFPADLNSFIKVKESAPFSYGDLKYQFFTFKNAQPLTCSLER